MQESACQISRDQSSRARKHNLSKMRFRELLQKIFIAQFKPIVLKLIANV